MDSLYHKRFFCILSTISNLSFSLNKSLIPSLSCFISYKPSHYRNNFHHKYGTSFQQHPFFSACFLFYSLRLNTARLQLGAIVPLGVQALDRIFLACSSNTFGVLNPSTAFNCPFAIALPNTLFFQLGFPFQFLSCSTVTDNALSSCLTYPRLADVWHPARRCCTVSLNLLHNLHCSWSVIPPIVFHLIVSTICSCRLKIAKFFLGFALHWNQMCSSSSTSFSSTLWIFF